MPEFSNAVERVGTVIDGIGVFAIALGILWAAFHNVIMGNPTTYKTFRHDLGRVILLGLELLIAGDIIRTVAVTPTN